MINKSMEHGPLPIQRWLRNILLWSGGRSDSIDGIEPIVVAQEFWKDGSFEEGGQKAVGLKGPDNRTRLKGEILREQSVELKPADLQEILIAVVDARAGAGMLDPFGGMVGIVGLVMAVGRMGGLSGVGRLGRDIPGTDPPDPKPDDQCEEYARFAIRQLEDLTCFLNEIGRSLVKHGSGATWTPTPVS